ncbi:hypothetical protein M3Y99_01026000 [Aphelenchoides fujianensis]|nr:hypothetical protein M3Y99_01026000 [Aphelenchoides fujianensis]
MSNGNWSAMPDDLVAAMRAHVQNLNERVAEASSVLEQSREVNEKITAMREYKDETNAVNGCFRSKDRTGLVRGLQSENRQIRQLQEENRQMKLALEDVQRGMGLIMEEAPDGRPRLRAQQRALRARPTALRFVPTEQHVREALLRAGRPHRRASLQKMGEQQTRDLEKYAAVCAENAHLRQALAGKGAKLVPKKADDAECGRPGGRKQSKLRTFRLPNRRPTKSPKAEAADSLDSTVVQPPAAEEAVAQVETEAPQTNVD